MDAENDNELSLEKALEKLMETDITEDARLKSGWQSIAIADANVQSLNLICLEKTP